MPPTAAWRGRASNLLLADTLAEQVAKHAKMMLVAGARVTVTNSKALVAAHPLRSLGYDFDVPVLPGDLRHRRYRHRLCP